MAGCCAQMAGFAVLSFRESRRGGLVSQGLGTSMLPMGNIVKNPKIRIPAALTWLIGLGCRRIGWIKEGDLKLDRTADEILHAYGN